MDRLLFRGNTLRRTNLCLVYKRILYKTRETREMKCETN